METNLKPCPFCGGEARIKARYYRAIDYYSYSGVCAECNASMDPKDTEAEAIEAWNTRWERTCNRVMHGLERDRLVSTVSYTCSECDAHIGRCYSYCPDCGAKVVAE